MLDANAKPEVLRRAALLDAALSVFARFGYRKTSMDEVARAASVSRQGLYLHFASKEELFRATVLHALTEKLKAASGALRDETKPIEARLVDALDEWVGRYVGVVGPDTLDLIEASGTLTGAIVAEHEQCFEEALAGAIAASSLASAYALIDVSAVHIARMLNAAANGFKSSCSSRQAFVGEIAVTVRILCALNRNNK